MITLVETIKQALEFVEHHSKWWNGTGEHPHTIVCALRQALEDNQSPKLEDIDVEPVVWMFQHNETGRIKFVDSQQVEMGFEQNNPRWQKIRPVYLHPHPTKLEEIEQYRMQMAGISTAALGYWKEGDSIHPDYDTPALRDVAKLYADYAKLHAHMQQDELAVHPNEKHPSISMLPTRMECGNIQLSCKRNWRWQQMLDTAPSAPDAPMQQPLTDELIDYNWQSLHDEDGNPPDQYEFAYAIEREIRGKA